MSLKLYNTLSGEKELFEPLVPDTVTMYVCGPTVYNLAHIGNARPVVVFDTLFRLLQFAVEAGAVGLHQLKPRHRLAVALVGGPGVPLDGLVAIGRNPAAVLVHRADVVLRLAVPVAGLLQCFPEQRRPDVAAGGNGARVKQRGGAEQISQHVHSHGRFPGWLRACAPVACVGVMSRVTARRALPLMVIGAKNDIIVYNQYNMEYI